MSKNSMHEKAVDWAIGLGYFMSVRDYSEEEFDLLRSQDRKAIIDAIEATEMPNVSIMDHTDPEIIERDGKRFKKYRRVAVFSVIDEGTPDETINDYVAKPGGEFDKWFDSQC